MKSLSLYSEPYAPSGNIGDGGILKLLGAPPFTLLQTVIRESVQNSCDATLPDRTLRVFFRIRRLDSYQRSTLAGDVFSRLPNEDTSASSIREFLNEKSPVVFEICDFETVGLDGPTRADLVPAGSGSNNFVNFLRNVGSSRDTHLGGGTYGFGKASLYQMSKCATIIVDTQTYIGDTPARRLMACHLGRSFSAATSSGMERRFTGRHWWGVPTDESGYVDPVQDRNAADLSDRLGMPRRDQNDTGTSIMILAPQLADDDLRVAGGMIQEALLWFFWPRLTKDAPAKLRIDFRIEVDGEPLELPAPEDFPPLDLFAKAISKIRHGSPDVSHISCQRPAKYLGSLAIERGLRAQRRILVPADASLFPDASFHIAIMRPVQLVVKYIQGDPLPTDRAEWAGVFIADSDDEVEEAFARSEPPAHDDWQPTMLPKGHQKTYVNVALQRIKEAGRSVANPRIHHSENDEEVNSLANISSHLGRLLISTSIGGAGPRRVAAKGGSTKRNIDAVGTPKFIRLELGDGRPVAIFEIEVSRSTNCSEAQLSISPFLALDGGGDSSDAELFVAKLPEVIEISSVEGGFKTDRSPASIGRLSGTFQVRISVPSNAAVSLKAQLVEMST